MQTLANTSYELTMFLLCDSIRQLGSSGISHSLLKLHKKWSVCAEQWQTICRIWQWNKWLWLLFEESRRNKDRAAATNSIPMLKVLKSKNKHQHQRADEQSIGMRRSNDCWFERRPPSLMKWMKTHLCAQNEALTECNSFSPAFDCGTRENATVARPPLIGARLQLEQTEKYLLSKLPICYAMTSSNIEKFLPEMFEPAFFVL